MSVINQMLKDLEQRRAQGFDNETGMLDDLSGAGGDDSEETSSKKSYWILTGVLLVVAIGVGVFFVQQWQQKTLPIVVMKESSINAAEPEITSTPEVVTKQSSVVKEIVVTEPVEQPAENKTTTEPVESIQQANVPEAVVTNQSPVVKEIVVTEPMEQPANNKSTLEPVESIQQADVPETHELVVEQLTHPVPANKVIVPVPGEQMAIETILPLPLIANGEREIITVHGRGFIAPLKVMVKWGGGRAFKDLEPWQIKVINQTEMQLHVNLGTSKDDWRLIIQQLETDNFAEYEFNVIAGNKKPVVVVNENVIEEEPAKVVGVFNKTVTPLTKAEQVRLTYAEATHLLQQGKTTTAKQVLRKLLSLDFTHIQARQTLAALLFQKQQYNEAIEVLELGRIQHPRHVAFTLLLARIYTERGQDAIAVELLEGLEPEVSSNSDYYALLAALYQRSAQYTNAASVYEKLLRVYPGRGVWWMGLGLSLQTTERKQDALSAYQKALQAQGLTVELKRFIEARVRILEQG